jgi:hypothetical protein
VARFDKYEPLTGGFRAALNANWPTADLNKIVGVSLNTSGKLIKGTAGQSGFVGVVCLNGFLQPNGSYTGMRYANDIVDVMQDGEIVELTGLIAGQDYYMPTNGDGVFAATGAGGLAKVGWTVEATRMIVRCNVTGEVPA